ncbi:phage tail domain-containing protein [Paenibacillus polysaccharolyticus]|uniref:phage tail domain-containing protein n=1 Tax=Paenibacillus polysaccharolyticus TaxID=582692 RepID=UPI0030097BCF
MTEWGIKINEIDLETIGFALIERSLPVLPETEDNTVKLAGSDGVIDFGSTFGPRVINVTLYCFAQDYHAALAQLAAMMSVHGPQIYVEFHDLPAKRYPVVYSGTLSVQATGSRTINLPLKMNDPWPQSLRDTAVNEYGQGLSYGQGYVYSDYAQFFNAAGTMPVRNEGTLPQSPVIKISGAFTNLTLSDGNKTIVISAISTASDTWEINCEKYTVKKNGINAYGSSNGVFFALNPGATTITVGGAGLAVSLAFVFRYKYLY